MSTDLHAALTSVAAHVHEDKDYAAAYRVVVRVGGENLTLQASSGTTAAQAIVSVWDTTGEFGRFDLAPSQVRDLLAVFPAKRPGKDLDGPEQTMLLEVSDEAITATDVSGLFPGKQLELPRIANDDNFPHFGQLFASLLSRFAPDGASPRLVVAHEYLAKFNKAASAYGQPLVIDPHGSAGTLLISCGESFIGALQPRRPDEEKMAEINAWHDAWKYRIEQDATDEVVTTS